MSAGSEASECGLRERREREEEREAEALGAEGEQGGRAEPQLFLPTPSFMASQRRSEDGSRGSFPFGHLSLCHFLNAHHIFLGQAWAEGKGELATCRHCVDSGRENRSGMYAAIV